VSGRRGLKAKDRERYPSHTAARRQAPVPSGHPELNPTDQPTRLGPSTSRNSSTPEDDKTSPVETLGSRCSSFRVESMTLVAQPGRSCDGYETDARTADETLVTHFKDGIQSGIQTSPRTRDVSGVVGCVHQIALKGDGGVAKSRIREGAGSVVIASVTMAVVTSVIATGPVNEAFAFSPGSGTFVPGNLLVSTSQWQQNANITAGTTQLPPNCGVAPYVDATCATAVTGGTYPYVFDNDAIDGSFGVAQPIIIDEITPTGTPVDSVTVPNSSQPGITSSSDQMVTSFFVQVRARAQPVDRRQLHHLHGLQRAGRHPRRLQLRHPG